MKVAKISLPPQLPRAVSCDHDTSSLKSKLRAFARIKGYSDNYYTQIFRTHDSGASGGFVTWDQFQHILRDVAKISVRLCTDSELKAIFQAIDTNSIEKIDVDQIGLFFGTSRTQRVALPTLAKHQSKKRKEREEELQRSKADVECAFDKQMKESIPISLTKFWYKQHAAYKRQVAHGKEYRLLLPFNLSRNVIKQRYEELYEEVGESAGRPVEYIMRQLFDRCGFGLSDERLYEILDKFNIKPGGIDPRYQDPTSKRVEDFFEDAFIDSSEGGWTYTFKPPPKRRPLTTGDEPSDELNPRTSYRTPDNHDQHEKRIRTKSPHLRPGQPVFSRFQGTQQRWQQDVAKGKIRKGTLNLWYSLAPGETVHRGVFDEEQPRKVSCKVSSLQAKAKGHRNLKVTKTPTLPKIV